MIEIEEVLEIHEKLIANFGGLAGVRDVSLLSFAIQRPSKYSPQITRITADILMSTRNSLTSRLAVMLRNEASGRSASKEWQLTLKTGPMLWWK
jgi:hypothetical protein